ncbi:Os03g0558400, partial [Oryza sativa Japonica Group]
GEAGGAVAQPDSPRGDGNSGANPQLRVDDGVAALQSYRGEVGVPRDRLQETR